MTDAPIHRVIAQVMSDVGPIAKRDRNDAQKFNFRGIDAVVNAVGPILRAHGVTVFPIVEDAHYEQVEVGQKRSLMRQCTLKVRWRFVGPAGDYLDAVVMAEAMDSGDKATSKAHSVSYRTVLLQVLCIPTDEPDPDASSYQRADAPAPVRVISKADAERLAEVLNKGGKPARDQWLARFGCKPADLPADRLEDADDFVSDLADLEPKLPIGADA